MIAVAMNGFLRSDTGVPIPASIKIYDALVRSFQVTVLADGPVPEAERWLAMRGLKGHSRIYGTEVYQRKGETLRKAQMSVLRALGPVELLIDPDPGNVAWAMSTGTAALLHLHPTYSRPEFRPDRGGIRRWDDIEAELDRQAELLASDQRIHDDTLNRWE